MKKQQKIQITLAATGIILILLTYFYYPSIQKNEIVKKDSTSIDDKKLEADDVGSTFENVMYKGMYDFDKPFKVESEKAYILNKEPDIVHMQNMHVTLYLSDERIVNIVSKKGRYNKLTYDCFFEENVEATDGETKIFSENLDLLATGNSVEIYNRVSLNYPNGSLSADKINYDFETKYFKVSMFDKKPIKMKVIE